MNRISPGLAVSEQGASQQSRINTATAALPQTHIPLAARDRGFA
jgi:hypothetical protein